MVSEDIKNTGLLGKPNEYFMKFICGNDTTWKEFKTRIKINSSTGNGNQAIKVMSNQVTPIENKYHIITKNNKNLMQILEELGEPNFVQIVRENKLYQALSQIIAKKTGIYHKIKSNDKSYGKTSFTNVKDNYNNNILINKNEIMDTIIKITKEEVFWDRFFSENNITPLRIHYENAISDIHYINLLLPKKNILSTEILQKIKDKRGILRLANQTTNSFYEKFSQDSDIKYLLHNTN